MNTADLVEFFQTRRAVPFPVAERLADAVVIRRKLDVDTDLFADVVTAPPPPPPGIDKRHVTQRKGYAAQPGTGPAGETCKSCKHIARIRRSSTYIKCGLARERWTHGGGTDILTKAPACHYWEAKS